MKRKAFLFIIIFNSISLIGILITQYYWVKESFLLKQEIFSNSVRMTLKGVNSQILSYQKTRMMQEDNPGYYAQMKSVPSVESINPGLFDFKIKEEFRCMKLSSRCNYAVVRMTDNTVLMGNFVPSGPVIRNSHQVPMTGFRNAENYILMAHFPGETGLIITRMTTWIILSVSFSLILVWSLYLVINSLFRHKNLSEMKSDFINNMTHEFKTPLATISLASEMLMKKEVLDDSRKSSRYAQIIYDENARMQYQVDQVLNVTVLDRGEFKLKKKELDLHKTIQRILDSFSLSLKERNGLITCDLQATRPRVQADEAHLINIINNLLDNASKYSPGTPEIRVETRDANDGIIVAVEDNGIGIRKEDQQQIFRKLFRVPTGNIHDIRGFGIGLYYVKTMVEAHGGKIKLWSDLGKGSRFEVYLPYRFNSSINHAE